MSLWSAGKGQHTVCMDTLHFNKFKRLANQLRGMQFADSFTSFELIPLWIQHVCERESLGRSMKRVFEKTNSQHHQLQKAMCRQGISYSLLGRRTVVHYYDPKAAEVQLVVEEDGSTWPMHKDRHGSWKARINGRRRHLYGKSYHFEVCRNGKAQIVADPFAHLTTRQDDRIVSHFPNLEYHWRHRLIKPPALNDLVIYETHLPALSRHPSAPVEDRQQHGTYRGGASPQIIDHLTRMGVAVEFLPLHAADGLLGQDWGYFSTSYQALSTRYASNILDTNREVMELIDALHARGIPVILDVVYNHGGELCSRAWGEDVVYRKLPDGNPCYGSGCGPTICTENPMVRAMIIKTLKHLVEVYRFDGFRFDLGALHDPQTMIEIDRALPQRIYLIAEPWALGQQKWSKGEMSTLFAKTRWAIWNDDFREPAKDFITGSGDFQNRDRLMRAIKGSLIEDGGWAQRPQQSINYITSHDGKTLADLVGCDKRRQFLGALLVLTSQGVPMLSEGSEFLFSKGGEHNSYNRPDLNQLDWHQALEHRDLIDGVAGLITLRKQLPHFHYNRRLQQRANAADHWDIDWIFPTGYPHDDHVNALGYLLRPPREQRSLRKRSELIILMNGEHAGVSFNLPEGNWHIIADGFNLQLQAQGTSFHEAHGDFYLHPGTGVILAHR